MAKPVKEKVPAAELLVTTDEGEVIEGAYSLERVREIAQGHFDSGYNTEVLVWKRIGKVLCDPRVVLDPESEVRA